MNFEIKKQFAVILLSLMLTACSHEPKIKNGHLETVAPTSSSNTLFYSGTIQPLRSLVLTSPVDGVVVEMPAQYGEEVESGQMVFMLSSAKFLSDYKSALMQYIKAKSDFNTSKAQLSEGEFLHKNLLISDDDFKMKQAGYYSNRLVLLQAKDALENLLQQMDIKGIDLYNLSISDVDKIDKAMHLQKKSENLRILSPAAGVLLAPAKSEDDTKKVAKGDQVKQGDVLAVIGDMGGITVRIKVNELTVNQLKDGQKIKVTGIAFPDDVLEGVISRVDRQADSSGSGIPSFVAEVSVPTLTKAQQKVIHVGMSAKVEINLNDDARMMIPATAIVEKDGATYVKKLDEKSRKIKEVLVRTGKTTPDSVAIIAGLNKGDRIVVPDQA
ncbi:MAG TPA: HlyD family efflux transporter periplasmic adaptor subunit [Gammaproteobacteria bacterium]|nr:HlyD family efflux transporter periplasmic adaptor subunit [Gammaproteobacteria bacterium]